MLEGTGTYPPNWPQLAYKVKVAVDWKCERCGHQHSPGCGYTLTVHHLDGNRENNEPWNLAALCQRCHLHIQQFAPETLLLIFNSPGVFGDNEAWLKPHLDGIINAVDQKTRRLRQGAEDIRSRRPPAGE